MGERVTLPIRWAGLDTKTDERMVPPQALLEATNVVYDRAPRLGKRYGYEELSTGRLDSPNGLPSIKALAKRGDELVAFSDDEVFSYQEDAGAWFRVGAAMSAKLDVRPLLRSRGDQHAPAYAVLGGIEVHAWVEDVDDSTTIARYAVLDRVTGAHIVPLTDLAGTRVRLAALSDVVLVIYEDGSAVKTVVVDPDDPANPAAAVTTLTVGVATAAFEVAAGAGRVAIAWSQAATSIGVGYIDSSGALGDGATLPDDVAIAPGANATLRAIAVDSGGSNRVAVLWSIDSSSALRCEIREADLSQATADFLVRSGTADVTVAAYQIPDASGQRALWVYAEDGSDPAIRVQVLEDGTVGSPVEMPGVQLASQPAAYGEHVYAWVLFATPIDTATLVAQGTGFQSFWVYLLLREDGLIVARGLSGRAEIDSSSPMPAAMAVSGSVLEVSVTVDEAPQNELLPDGTGLARSAGLYRLRADLAPADGWQTVEVEGNLYIGGGGFLQLYDGRGIAEASFHYAPPQPLSAPTTGSPTGDGVDVGEHLYRMTYARYVNGAIVRSGSSVGTTVTVASSAKRVTIAVPTMRYTAADDVFIEVWRSLANDDSKLYRVSSADPALSDASSYNRFLANDPSVGTVTFLDDMSDAVAATREELYTSNGTLSNDPAPVGHAITWAGSRVFAVSSEHDHRLVFSQQLGDGLAVEMVPSLRIDVPSGHGRVIGLAELDGALLIFAERAVYITGGEGPGPDGASGSVFPVPQLVTAEAGCADARTIVGTPVGVMFWAGAKGWHLIDRSRQLRYIGAAVEKFSDPRRSAQTFVAASLIADRRQIRCLTSAGHTLLYDYERDAWADWDNHAGLSSVVVGGLYHYVRTNGAVWRETPGSYSDAGAFIKRSLRTGWLRFFDHAQGLQRFGVLQIQGVRNGNADVRLRAFLDFEADAQASVTFDTSAIAGLDTDGQLEVHVGHQGKALQLTIEDVDAGEDVDGFAPVELVLSGSVKRVHSVLAADRKG